MEGQALELCAWRAKGANNESETAKHAMAALMSLQGVQALHNCAAGHTLAQEMNP